MSRSALQVVPKVPFYYRDLDSQADSVPTEGHSLHALIPYPDVFKPELANYLIRKFSSRGDVVLDPFSRGGVVALEANLLGRAAIASDINPLSLKITRAKVEVADITEVTLLLQEINLRRPIDTADYRDVFSSFYDIDTFRELVNLKGALRNRNDKIARFVEVVALSLLHGHTAGYFSAYTFPQISVEPHEQRALNLKRGQIPDYRAVVPRILRKTASILRDGGFTALKQMERRNSFAISDPRDMRHVLTASVDFAIMAPPRIGRASLSGKGIQHDMWLRYWFSGLSNELAQVEFGALNPWHDYMNEVLVELSRVVKARGRAAIDLREISLDGKNVLLDEELLQVVEEQFSRFWEPEGVLVYRPGARAVPNAMSERDPKKRAKVHRVLILRRR